MPKLAPELTTGFPPLDNQHPQLLERIDAAGTAARAGDVETAARALAGLGDYVLAHFAAEELFMTDSSYPERVRHKAAHDLFVQDLLSLTREVEAGGLTPDVVQRICERVPGWLRFHIQVNDVPLGRWLAHQRQRAGTDTPRDKHGAS